MSGEATEKLVLAPEATFAAIEQALSHMGWSRTADTATLPPLVPGEPEFAVWTRSNPEARIHYSCNPVVGLRVLAVSGKEAHETRVELRDTLPCLTPSALQELLADPESRRVLLGLYAARELLAIHLFDEIQELTDHDNPRISETAAATCEALAIALAELGLDRLKTDQARHPGRSALFPHLGSTEVRRNLVRWLIRDAIPGEPGLPAQFAAAVHDDDWLVRLLGAIGAARFGVTGLWPDIRRMDLPRTGREGANAQERSMLLALRGAILGELSGAPPASGPRERARLEEHLRNVVIGRDDGIRDAVRAKVEDWLEPTDSNPAFSESERSIR